jgi:2-succinyl-5-enolpyruvyl-6-hydroxy-3-cyclohexene-1-carboxylate synthase
VTSAAEALDVAVGAFVAELSRAGVRHVCVCPGSRSTPLAIKLAQEPSIKLWVHLDERSAAYFGLGLARALREPVAILATSGTAAANFLPAVVEANLSRVPLVVLTADRPHELRDNGAAQTIDQLRLYGAHVKWFFDLPEPEATLEHVRLVRTLAARAVGTAVAEPAGPVHLNWPFREPLVPTRASGAWGARPDRQPYVTVDTGRLAPSPALIQRLSSELAASGRGVIVCGPQDDPDLPAAIVQLAQRLRMPVLADPLSGVRCGVHDLSLVIDAYDAFLRDESTLERLAPRVVLRFGALPTSKPLLQYLERYSAARQIVVDPGGWREPTGLASDMLHVDPRLLCEALLTNTPTGGPEWAEVWTTVNRTTRAAIDRYLDSLDELFEGRIFAALPALLPDGGVLFAGNSMPVRDLDTFLPANAKPLRCVSNRGANGIDGVVSSALGTSAAGPGPVVLVIGDISLYHDLNGLLAARKFELDLVVVLINNDGGGIFSFLSQAEAASGHFEALFGTPHGLDFRPFIEGYGGHFVRAQDWPGVLTAVADGLHNGGLHVVEVPTQRTRNVDLHRAVWRAVATALAPTPVG